MRLSRHFHVCAIDALYHGFSTKEPYDAQQRVLRQAEAVIDFMDAEGIPWAHVEGESMGAGIAFEMGMRWPDRCGKLVLNSGNYYIRSERLREPGSGGANELMAVCRAAASEVTRERIRERMQYFVAHPDCITEELVELQYRLYSDPEILASMRRVFGMDAPRGGLAGWTEEDAGRLKAPTLVLWTDRNPSASPEAGAYLAGLFPNGTCRIIHDACHWPQWEHPEEHDRVVTEFLMA